ncbi:alpha/beta hydrolase [Rhodococcus triatomae]|uniref:Lysophospholipase, alpha-beta hydrolase superfamily n=1 Tax=Rhodococcus triatomae TaxID=300028 RepID=A0A1G8FQK3_9NOCA|nr:alpha/beta hydrolase [Rhodococcus triatomae]QNG19550.1 alpha/beta hydrolase [Rhodococcus triatomae]QNG24535.1 alpha/beta hydrolase [Rhodococcus triatomae]SDH84432.1 Lysophospholipase, alpha-beta hydrolase superfamily [Rhodococcus triatomae]
MDTSTTTLPRAGLDIAYRDFGPAAYRDSGPAAHDVPVVLVHGMGGDGRTWDRFARELTGVGRRVVTMDLRGHGRSARAASYRFAEFGSDVAELCDTLGIARADLVGHSLGGHAASLVAQTRPDLVRRLVIEEAPLPLRPGDPEQTFTRRLPSAVELWHATTSLIRSPRAVVAFDRSMTGPALAQFRTPDPQWWERLPRIAAPTLFLSGGPTGMVDAARLDAAVAAIPECTVVPFACGHSIHRDRHRDFVSAVLPFLSRP